MTILFLYLTVACFVGFVVYVISNPYGHISRASQWRQTLLGGLLWPFWMVWIIVVLIYYRRK